MFKPLLDKLYSIYPGNIIYIPSAIYGLVTEWIEQSSLYRRSPVGFTEYRYNDKVILPYDEDEILKAYQSVPIHVPERILEKSIIIETSLFTEEPVKVEKEVKVEEKPVEKPVSYGRRAGTKKRNFNQMF